VPGDGRRVSGGPGSRYRKQRDGVVRISYCSLNAGTVAAFFTAAIRMVSYQHSDIDLNDLTTSSHLADTIFEPWQSGANYNEPCKNISEYHHQDTSPLSVQHKISGRLDTMETPRIARECDDLFVSSLSFRTLSRISPRGLYVYADVT